MININIVLGILFIHWVFDFVLQPDKTAKAKGSSVSALLRHTSLYSIQWFSVSGIWYLIIFDPWILLFAPITFVLHTITDYYTSRVGKELYREATMSEDHHNFFVNIGFDQYLHQIQLLLTYYFLTK